MTLHWQPANPGGILMDLASNVWHAGHTNDLLPLSGANILAGTHTGGVWQLGPDGSATNLSDTWDTPDISCVEAGPDGPHHIFVAANTMLFENRADNLQGWRQIDFPPGAQTVFRLAVLVGSRRLIAACNNGLFWADIPIPDPEGRGRYTYRWQTAQGLSAPAGGYFGLAAIAQPASWSGFTAVPAATLLPRGRSIAVVARLPTRRDIFWVNDADGSIGSTWWDLLGVTGGWYGSTYGATGPGVAAAGSAIAAVARTPNNLDLFWIASDGSIGSTWMNTSLFGLPDFAGHNFTVAPAEDAATAAAPGSGMAAVARYPTHLDVFWVDRQGTIRSTWWDQSNPHVWASAFPISPTGVASLTSPISVVARTPDNLDVFWIKDDGSIMWTSWDAYTPWTGRTQSAAGMGAASTTGGISAVARTARHLDVFWVAPNGSIGTAYWDQDDPSGWHVYSATPNDVAETDSSVVAVARNPNHLDVFWIDPMGNTRTTWWDAYSGGGLLADGYTIGHPATGSDIRLSAIAPHEDGLDLFLVDYNGSLLTNTWRASGGRVVVGAINQGDNHMGLWSGQWQPDADGHDQLIMAPSMVNGLNQNNMSATSVAMSRYTGTAYAVATDLSTGTAGRLYGVLRSDNGATWSACETALTNPGMPGLTLITNAGNQGNVGLTAARVGSVWNNCIAASPVDPNTVLLGWENGPFLSQDGGQSWTQWSSPHLHEDIHALRFDLRDTLGRTVYIASDGGVAATSDLGMTFTSSYNRQLANLQCYTTDAFNRQSTGTLGVSYQVQGLVATGLQDNGNVWCIMDPTPTPWHEIDGTDGGVATFVRDNQLLRTTTSLGLQAGPRPVNRAEWDAGTHSLIDRGVIPITLTRPGASDGSGGLTDAMVAFVNDPVIRDMSGAKIEAIGWSGSDVYGLYNPTGSSDWRWEFLGSLSLASGDTIAAGGSANSNIIFLGTGLGRIFTMDSHTGVPTEQTISNPDQNYGVNRLCVLADDNAFALYNTWRGRVQGGRILRLQAGTWGALMGGGMLPNERFYAIEADWRTNPPVLYACTDSRVYVSRDGQGNTWSEESEGLPQRAHCADLRFVVPPAGPHRLYLSTFGRSVWVANL